MCWLASSGSLAPTGKSHCQAGDSRSSPIGLPGPSPTFSRPACCFRRGAATSRFPIEALEAAHLKMRLGLASELLNRVKTASPQFFERLVVELLLKMGYGGSRRDAGQAIGRAGDEGIDGVISEDRLGLDVVYLQAKKWDGTVGRPEIQRFVGALHGKRATKGVFITTGTFSADASAYVDRIDPKVVLIDGRRLAELMVDFEVGVNTAATYNVKRVDSDYFDETGAV
jgi:restriction system protein